jgi:hypothetical protein
MTRKNSNYYWIFILILQVIIIARKIMTDEFYLWNIVALAGSIFFIYNRIFLKKVVINSEMPLAGFIGINAVMTFLAQIIYFESYLVAIISLLVAAISFFMIYYIWKTESLNKN